MKSLSLLTIGLTPLYFWGCQNKEDQEVSLVKAAPWIWYLLKSNTTASGLQADLKKLPPQLRQIILTLDNDQLSPYTPNNLETMQEYLSIAHEMGFKVRLGFSPIQLSTSPTAFPFSSEEQVVDKSGNDQPLLCPRNPSVKDRIQTTLNDLTELKFIDGIYLHQLYYPPTKDLCYCNHCRSQFESRYQVDPVNHLTPSQETHWDQFRRDGFTDLINLHLAPIVRAKNLLLGSTVEWNYSASFQQWQYWDVDKVIPQFDLNNDQFDTRFIALEASKMKTLLHPKQQLEPTLYPQNFTALDLAKALETIQFLSVPTYSIYQYDDLSDELIRTLTTS